MNNFNRWEGTGENEVGKEKDTNIVRIKIDSKYYRPTEVVSFDILYFNSIFFICLKIFINLKEYLQGSPEKAYKNFGWKPKITFAVYNNFLL